MRTRSSLSGGKAAGLWSWPLASISAEVKNVWGTISLPQRDNVYHYQGPDFDDLKYFKNGLQNDWKKSRKMTQNMTPKCNMSEYLLIILNVFLIFINT
jgi:hypothetical protein